MPLTDVAIRQAQPRDKPRKLYDSRGLYLEIAPRGTKAWRFKYRFADREKRISLGIYPEVSLRLARERRDEARKLLARDVDPSAYRKAQKKAKRQWARDSFEAVAREWLAKHSPNWTTRHADRVLGQLERDVFPWIGSESIAELTAPELLAVLRRIEERGALRMAHGTLQICGRVLRYAVATGRAERDVSWDLRGALPPAKTKHLPAITDPKEVGPLLRVLNGYPGTLPVRCALRLAPLVFVRPGELRRAEWTEIDRAEGVWTVPARRTKSNREHRVPLCGRAIEILEEARPLVEGTSPFLFPNRIGKQLEEKQLRRMFQKHGIAAVPHGFRSSFRDWAAEETNHPREVIEAALAHVVQNRVEAGLYAH